MLNLKNIGITFLCCCSLFGCSNNATEQDNSIEIYSNGTLISLDKELSMQLGDTIDLKINSSSDSVLVFSNYHTIEILRYAANSYKCVSTSAGEDQILLVPMQSTDIYTLNVATNSYKDEYSMVSCSYSVKVPSSTIAEYEILNQLKNSYIPNQYGVFSFHYTTMSDGDFVYYKFSDKSDSIYGGTFSVLQDSIFTLKYNNTEQTVNISKSSGLSTNLLTTDMMDIFKAKYPSAVIDSVRIVARANKTRIDD